MPKPNEQAEEKPVTKENDASKDITVRVLSSRNIAGEMRYPNDVITLPRDLAETLESMGVVDSSEAAIEYAQKAD